jgi:preprotein translocase subunit SecA
VERLAQRRQHAHHFAIVDEADSILIDEARTPLIISAPDAEPTSKYFEFARLVTSLEKNSDYSLDEKSRTVTLTDLGVKRVEQKLGVKNLYEENFDTIHHIESALKAKTLYLRDKDYIVRENQVIIVDEHTGRLMYGRRYSDGLHQSIEAKEGVPIQQESRTLATISIQNYFRLYSKLSGMTGTAATEAEEFQKIYNTGILVVPTNQPISRDDKQDIVYKTTAVKYSAIAAEVEEIHKTGQPILIGTRSIDHNEVISNFLKRKKIPHQVLNAKNHEREAFIIADAGKKGAITVATNIAGRGVDIVLGGAKPELKDFRLEKKTGKKPTKKALELAEALKLPPSIDPANYDLVSYSKELIQWQKNHDEVVASGGLYILGTERHESRRIDNQLRGRAGRQGDPGTSQFYISLEDDIMRIFGGEQITKVMDFLKFDENQPIEHNMIGKAIESAQVKVEGFFFDQRKRLVEFDDVMNKQREIIYKRRRRLLEKTAQVQEGEAAASLREEVSEYVKEEISSLATLYAPQDYTPEEYNTITKEFSKIIPFDASSQRELQKTLSKYHTPEEITDALVEVAEKTYTAREKALGDKQMRTIERLVTLSTIDEKWMDHLDAMDSLREGIWLRGDKRTVLSEYKKEAFGMFETLINQIESTIASRIFRAHLEPLQAQAMPTQIVEHKEDVNESLDKEVQDASLPQPAAAPTNTKGSLSDLAAALGSAKKAPARPQPGVEKMKIGRNDPCPCGSGLKYKKCGLINAPQHTGG